MDNDNIYVTFFDNEPVAMAKGVSLLELSREFQHLYKFPIILSKVNNEFVELNKALLEDSHVEFFDHTHPEAMRVYQRSHTFLLICVVKEIFGKCCRIVIEHSINKNYFCEILDDNIVLNQDILDKIELKMHELIENNFPIEKQSFPLEEGIKIVRSFGMEDKIKILKYRRTSNVNLYKLTWFYDYFYGGMVPSTGCLKLFKLYLHDSGFILQFPSGDTADNPTQYKREEKISQVFKEYKHWGRILRIDTVGAFNDAICQGKSGELIRITEALQEKKIAQIADMINLRGKEVRIILIAGPSSSGKTTFAERLGVQLRVNGLIPHIISVDNYFVNRDKTPKDEYGNYDFEALDNVDIETLNNDLKLLLDGERIQLPTYNFIEGKREYKNNYLKLNIDDIIILEGIHSLNDSMTYSIPRNIKYKIYISALTQLNIDDHNRIPTTDTRLIRRIVRDNQYRGARAAMTISMWPSVIRGEIKNIFPYQEDADIIFNSALIYELSVLKPYVEPLLFQINRTMPEYPEAKRLIKFLDYFLVLASDEVPKNSILREFIGGGCFHK